MFDWFRDNDPDGLDAYSKNDLELEAKSIKTDMKIKENELDDLDQNFLETAQEAAQASGPKRNRLKSEASAIKQDYEQRQAEYQAMLKEYTTIRTLTNAKSRLESKSESMLREMDESELRTFREDIKEDILKENQELANMEEVANTIDETLVAVTGGEAGTVDSDVEAVIDAFEQGEDVSDFSLAEQVDETETETSTDTSSLSLSDL